MPLNRLNVRDIDYPNDSVSIEILKFCLLCFVYLSLSLFAS